MKRICIFLVAVFFVGCGSSDNGVKYMEGDNVFIVKNATQGFIDTYKMALQIPEEEVARTLLSKTLEKESCESLGFKYKETSDEGYGAVKGFAKGKKFCQETTFKDSAQQGNISMIFFSRKK